MTFSIITPTKARPTLQRTIDSVTPQLQPGDEHILAYSHPLPETLVGKFRTVRAPAHPKGNLGRDVAMSKARGDWFIFVDDDDVLLPGALDFARGILKTGHIYLFQLAGVPNVCSGERFVLTPDRGEVTGGTGGSCLVLPNDGRAPMWRDAAPTQVEQSYDVSYVRAALAIYGEPVWIAQPLVYINPDDSEKLL